MGKGVNLTNNAKHASIKTEVETTPPKNQSAIRQSPQTSDVDLFIPLSYYQGQLDLTYPILFPYLSDEAKAELERRLQITYLLLLGQKEEEIAFNQYDNYTTYNNDIRRCEEYLKQLNLPQKSQALLYLSKDRPVAFLGISLGMEIGADTSASIDEGTKELTKELNAGNQKRLYWIWGSSFLKTVLAFVPDNFFHTVQARKNAELLDPYAGMLSWTLYYFRFFIQFNLLLKHTIAGSWMSEEEKKIPWNERLVSQFDQRKFPLINDSVWGFANMACFLWLNAKTGLGVWGDLVTVFLLIVDICLVLWNLKETNAKHQQEVEAYQKSVRKLQKEIARIKAKDATSNAKRIKELELQLNDLTAAQQQFLKEWEFTKLSLCNEIVYSIGLLIAFVLLAMPFVPLSPPVLMVITLTGAVLCLAFTVIYNAINSNIAIAKTKSEIGAIKEKRLIKLCCFLERSQTQDPKTDKQLQGLFLEILLLDAETQYQQQCVVLQTMHFYRKVMLESLIPALIFASLVFFPMGIGFGILGATVALIILSNSLIERLFKPVKEPIDKFPDSIYEKFCEDPMRWRKMPSPNHNGLFKPKSETKEEVPICDTNSCSPHK